MKGRGVDPTSKPLPRVVRTQNKWIRPYIDNVDPMWIETTYMWIRSRSTPHIPEARPSLTHTVGYVSGTKRTVFTGN